MVENINGELLLTTPNGGFNKFTAPFLLFFVKSVKTK